jgi:signal transduction histidine kinase
MGLAIAKGIVEAHYGKIWIEPGRDGKGTRRVVHVADRGWTNVIEEPRYTTAT